MSGPKLEFQLENEEELLKKLLDLGETAKKIIAEATLAGAQVVADVADGIEPDANVTAKLVEKRNDQATAAIGPDREHWYYQFQQTGAKEHTIKAKKAQRLLFEGDNGLVVAQEVQHPGRD